MRLKVVILGIPVSTSTASSINRKRYSAVAWIKDVNSNNQYDYICGAAWISKNWVITVKDCLTEHGFTTKAAMKNDLK